MTRLLALPVVLLLLAGCASQAGNTAGRGPQSVPSPGRNSGLSASPPVSFTPVGTVSVGHAHRVRARDLSTAAPRVPTVNCRPASHARAAVRVTPSPATSHVRICLRVGQFLLVGRSAGVSYHWSKPRLLGAAGVLVPTPHPSAVAAFRARTPGTVALMAVGSPPAGSLAASFQWLAKVTVR
jgi:hypothetical protein